MGVYTHVPPCWAGGDQGLYHPPPEHGCTVNFNLSCNAIVYGGGAEFGTAPIQATVGASCSIYLGDMGGACSSGREGGDHGLKNQKERESRFVKDEGRGLI